jgi:arsenate reductase
MTLTVYGIPSCGTVKKARAWLQARGVAFEDVDLRATPPTEAKVARWAAVFGATALRNTSGGSYRALGPEKDGWTEAQWVKAMASDPMLIKRPVIERAGEPVLVGFRGSDEQLSEALIG